MRVAKSGHGNRLRINQDCWRPARLIFDMLGATITMLQSLVVLDPKRTGHLLCIVSS